LELGKAIASALDDTDTLGRWMAHYLAEQLDALDALQGAELAQAESEVADLIIRLWRHRRSLPTRSSALAAVDSVERAIARLDPDRPMWGYYSPFGDEPTPGEQITETDASLRVALAIDRAAGDVVHALVGYAAATAEVTDAEWVQLGLRVGDETLRRVRRIRFETASATVDDWSALLTERTATAFGLLKDLSVALNGVDPAEAEELT